MLRINNARGDNKHLDNYAFETLSKIINFILNNIEEEFQDQFSKKNVLGNSATNDEEKLDEKLKTHLEIFKMAFLLAQTYYVGEGQNKKYLQEEIKGNKIFKDMTLWKKTIDYTIEQDVKKKGRARKNIERFKK